MIKKVIKEKPEKLKILDYYLQITQKGFEILNQNKSQLNLIEIKPYIIYDKKESIELINQKIKQNNYDPIDFLEIIVLLFKKKNNNVIRKNIIEIDREIQQYIKKYLKHIKKSLKFIKNNFDEHYLLFKNLNNYYNSTDNFRLIYILQELSHYLTLANYNTQAQICFNIKSKIELGIQRYLIFEKENFIIYNFNKEGKYCLANNSQLIYLNQYYSFDIKIKKNLNLLNFKEFLYTLILLKKNDKVKFTKVFIKYYSILKEFPQKIIKDTEYQIRKKVLNSINKDLIENNLHIKKQKITLINLYHLETINIILELIQDEQ
ncbi:MAG: hypothetical protein ACOC16_02750 [Nanoarchaeota archaeon]